MDEKELVKLISTGKTYYIPKLMDYYIDQEHRRLEVASLDEVKYIQGIITAYRNIKKKFMPNQKR